MNYNVYKKFVKQFFCLFGVARGRGGVLQLNRKTAKNQLFDYAFN